MTVHKILGLLLIIFPVCSRYASAQSGRDGHFAPIARNFCGIKACSEANIELPMQGNDFHKAIDAILAEKIQYSRHRNYLKNDPPAEHDFGLLAQNINAWTQSEQKGNASGLGKKKEGDETLAEASSLLRNEDKGFSSKFLRASIVVNSAQISNLLMMVQFPDAFNYSCSSWDEAKSNLHRAWTSAPVWDKDPWMTNFIGHPYVGAYYYNMMRSQGSSIRTSYLFSTGQSLLWEFVIEAVAEQPSVQDLIFTSNLGSFFGELSHRAVSRMGRNGFSPFEKILATLINPGYVLNNGFNKRSR